MFITLDNAHPEHRGQKVTVNTDNIVTMTQRNRWMFDGADDHEGHSESVTFLFMPPHGSWEVVQSIAEINRMIHIPGYGRVKNIMSTLAYRPEAAAPPPPPTVTITPVDPATGEALGEPIHQPITNPENLIEADGAVEKP
jgi:hypothetical protein